jgi:hypothetical protein
MVACGFLRAISEMFRWVEWNCFSRLVVVVMAITRRHANPETMYRMLWIKYAKLQLLEN